MNKIYVIRQGRLYYSDVLDERHYMYGFLHRTDATRFTQFLKTYNKRHSRYPYIGQRNVVLRSTRPNTDSLFIDVEPLEMFQYKCVINGTRLFGIENFDYTDENGNIDAHISGGEIEGNFEPHLEAVVDNLEFLFLENINGSL